MTMIAARLPEPGLGGSCYTGTFFYSFFMSLSSDDYRRYFNQAIPFDTYFERMEAEAAARPDTPHAAYLPINVQRSRRILKTLELPDTLRAQAAALLAPQHWLVISEHWCGDAAQIVPVLHRLAEASEGRIDLRLIYRDEHPTLMDAHLTGQSRAIPKLVRLDTDFRLLGDWGPRPAEAQALVLALRANPDTRDQYAQTLHQWYARDRQKAILLEMAALL
jgi:hypothetical protein